MADQLSQPTLTFRPNRRSEVNLADVQFGVPQGSVLGPMLFNLYVTDLQDNLPSTATTFQYADDTTIYTSFRPGNLCQTAEGLNSTLQKLISWSSSAQLALDPTKTEAMLLSTSQMARVHSLHENRQLREIDEKVVQYVQKVNYWVLISTNSSNGMNT